jgi:hypothetical protein
MRCALSLPRTGRVAAGGGRVGWLSIKLSIDDLQDARQISIDIAIPKTENTKPGAGEFEVAFSVFHGMTFRIVLPAIDFDNKTSFQTYKINDVAFPGRLATKMKAARSPRAQMIPDFHFLWRESLPELSRDFARHWRPPPGSLRSPPSPVGGGIRNVTLAPV